MRQLYSVKAYHSTRQKGLKKFESRTTTATIDTGEGVHVHGWGLYLQADEMQNREMYLKGFAGVSTRGSDYKVTIYGKTVNAYYTDDICSINDYDSFSVYDFDDDLEEAVHLLITLLLNGYEPSYIHDILIECIDNGVSDEDDFEDETPEILLHWSDDAIIDAANLALEVNDWDAEEIPEEVETLPDGTHYEGASQYTVEIPDDMVFIDEDKPVPEWLIVLYVDQLLYVTEDDEFHTTRTIKCADIANGKYTEENGFMPRNASEELSNLIKERRKEFIKKLKKKRDLLMSYYKLNKNTGGDFYNNIRQALNSDEQASLWLSENGIDGMTYEGGRDHGCFVIYNCDKLKIIAEY